MALVARSSTGVAGVLAFAVVAALAIVGWLLWPGGSAGQYLPARATVVQPASCGPAGDRDVVRVELDGREVRAELDGCGHHRGEVLAVEVAADASLEVRLAGTGVSAEAAAEQRLSAVGTVLAGAAGAALAWRLRPGRPQRPPSAAAPSP